MAFASLASLSFLRLVGWEKQKIVDTASGLGVGFFWPKSFDSTRHEVLFNKVMATNTSITIVDGRIFQS